MYMALHEPAEACLYADPLRTLLVHTKLFVRGKYQSGQKRTLDTSNISDNSWPTLTDA